VPSIVNRAPSPDPEDRVVSRERTKRARLLRRTMTGVELILWKAIRKRKVDGFRFRRQDPIEEFVVDFSCPAARLVVEVDGPRHEGRTELDELRDARLRALGYRTMRFWSDDVLSEVEWVVAEIEAALNEPPPGLRPALPHWRGGETYAKPPQ
jgi:very-short-patch-repair endonuclease